jgi:hypothetical protein
MLMNHHKTLTACCAAVLRLCLQAELLLCRYNGLSLFLWSSPGTAEEVSVKVDNVPVIAGKFTFQQSVEAAVVADVLLEIACGKRKNFPGEVLQQVGCLGLITVMACGWPGV